jgi:hypothetical protein
MVVSYVATPDAGAGVRGVWGMIIAATMSCYVVAGGEPTRTLARDAIARNQINTSPTDYASPSREPFDYLPKGRSALIVVSNSATL